MELDEKNVNIIVKVLQIILYAVTLGIYPKQQERRNSKEESLKKDEER